MKKQMPVSPSHIQRDRIDEILTEEFLRQKIEVEFLYDREIANIVNCGISAVQKRKRKFGIHLPKNRDRNKVSGKIIEGVRVLDQLTYVRNKQKVYNCECLICGRIWAVMLGNILHGLKSCGCTRFGEGSKSGSWRGYGELTGSYYSIIRNGAATRGLEFSITMKYIWELFLKQNRKCRFSGQALIIGKPGGQTASLDRIDSSRGYVEGNVQWVHKDVNFMKQELSDEYFIKMCKEIAENCK